METSLSVQNDAILKKAKWWILSALVLNLMSYCITDFIPLILLKSYGYMREELNDFYSIRDFINGWIKPVLNILYIIGCVALLKHSVKSIRVLGKILIIFSVTEMLFGIMNEFVRDEILQMLFEKNQQYYNQNEADILIWSFHIIPYIEILVSNFIFLMGLGALWKNKQIRENHTAVIRLFALLVFVEFVKSIPNIMWFIRAYLDSFNNNLYEYTYYLLGSGWYIPQIISIVSQILFIYCYCKLLKTPSAMPVEDTEPYSYRPTKIEIGFLFAVCLFVGLIFLSFLMV